MKSMQMSADITVLVAMEVEARSILKNPFYGWKETEEGLFRAANVAPSVCLVLTGVGKVNATWALARARMGQPQGGSSGAGSAGGKAAAPHLIISMGTSGALDETPVGTMVLCDEFVEHDMDVTAFGYPAGVTPNSRGSDPVYRTAGNGRHIEVLESVLAAAGIGTIRGRALSGDLFLGDAALAARKRELFGGDGAVLVDMECAAVAKICATVTHEPYLALRYVSDNADHNAGTSWDAEVVVASARFDTALRAILAGFQGWAGV